MPDEPDFADLVERVETQLLGGERRYNRHEVAERAGLDLETVRGLWRALGFASVNDDERIFTDADVDALRNVARLSDAGDIDADVMYAMTRIIGQTFARLASWQGQVVVNAVLAKPELLGDGAGGVTDLVGEITPLADALHSYVWRRQLAAYFSRSAANTDAGIGPERSMAVGFVDMAGFTTLTREASEADLRAVLGAFETLAGDTVAAHRGQVVKTIGDEVLFTADRPDEAAAIALDLLEAAEADDRLPPLRAGLAYGPVVDRLGDVFGQTVNIASRLTTAARTNSVLVDDGVSDALHDDERFALRALRPMSVRGYHHLRSWRLRRAS